MAIAAERSEPATAVPTLQRTLTVGAVNDPLEREADAIADRVMRMSDTEAANEHPATAIDRAGAAPIVRRCPGGCPSEEEGGGPSLLQRCPGGGPSDEMLRREAIEEEDEELQRKAYDGRRSPAAVPHLDPRSEAVLDRHRGGGGALTSSTRGFFEPRLGADLSAVRVHTGGAAAALAARVNARAFTVGRDVFFGAGEFQPTTAAGRRLLAHELAHTRQQGANAPRSAA